MNKLRVIFSILILSLALPEWAAAESFTLHQTLRQVMQTYPSVDIAQLQARRAQQDIVKAKSMLGWGASGQLGINHDLSLLSGAPTDTRSLSAGLERPLASGGSLGVSGSYSYDDNSAPLAFPGFLDPSQTTRVDATYRKPLGKGAGNPAYKEGLKSAKAGERIARANAISVHDGLASQTMELFFMAAVTKVQLETSKDAIDRAQRLKKYIRGNARLGLSEDKDLLQAEAQLQARIADYDGVITAWEQQRTSINRLLNRPRDAEFDPALYDKDGNVDAEVDTILEQVKAHSPDLHRQLAQVEIAEAQLAKSKDTSRSTWDLVLGAGYGNKQGQNNGGAGPYLSQNDYAASARLEFRRALDNRGLVAEVTQAQIDRSIALREAERIRDDMKYNVSGLIAEIDKTSISLASQQQRVKAERKKVDEATKRYRAGRTDTTQLIQFENDYQLSKLASETKRIELARKHASLNLMRGILLQDVMAPAAKKGEQ